MTEPELRQQIAQAVHQSFWEMEGGTGTAPGSPNAGDGQLAYDICRLVPEVAAALRLKAAVDGLHIDEDGYVSINGMGNHIYAPSLVQGLRAEAEVRT